MPWKIQISRAKPNPAGKDKAGNQPLGSQLLGEWVDLKNVGDAAVALSALHLAHTEFGVQCVPKPQPSIYWDGPAGTTLRPGEIVRVHTGKSRDSSLMKAEDNSGVHYHSYAERGSFVLNNVCGDNLSVWWQHGDKWHRNDQARYAPNPPEGKVLQRVGENLA
jgi:hypothetical protein